VRAALNCREYGTQEALELSVVTSCEKSKI
jgi:hypothetical protein